MERTVAEAATTLDTNNQPSPTKPIGSRSPAQTTTGTADARTDIPGKGHMSTPPSCTTCPMNRAQDEDQQHYIADWELTDEDALPESSTLSSNKALMDQNLEDESNSKKTKKTNTGKGKKVIPSTRNDGEQKTTGAR